MSCVWSSRVAGDDLETACGQRRVVGLLQHQLGPAENRIQRRPQLVRDHRHEVVLQTIGALGFGASRALGDQQPLTFARRGLTLVIGASPLAHVAKHEHDADDAAITIANRRATVVDRPLGAVCRDQQRVVREADDHAFLQDARDRILDRPAASVR